MDLYNSIRETIYNFFVKSNDYNGIPLRQVSTDLFIDYENSIDIIKKLVQDGEAVIQSSTNPHIYNFKYKEEDQLNVLESAKGISERIEKCGSVEIHIEETEFPICLYPSKRLLEKRRDTSNMSYYTKQLALCEPQLKVLYFDLNVLERYSNDPRYELHYDNYRGWISYICDEEGNSELSENNQVYIKSFGLGYDEKSNRVICMFLKDLGRLSDSHQAYWYSYEVGNNDCKMVEEYYANMIEGRWTAGYSTYHAFTCELNMLDKIANAIFGQSLFLSTFDESTLTFSFLPTSKNYYDFVLKLDKMISDNLNRDFFKFFNMEMYTFNKSEDVVERINKGTIQLFEEWLLMNYHTEDTNRLKDIFKSFRKVRKERQVPAHKTIDNVFSKDYAKRQDTLMREVYLSMSSLRHIFQQHPNAKDVEVPKWLDEGIIKMF